MLKKAQKEREGLKSSLAKKEEMKIHDFTEKKALNLIQLGKKKKDLKIAL
jgi:hypothetical protein